MSEVESPRPRKRSPAPAPVPFNLPENVSKHTVRCTVWYGMRRARLANFKGVCWAMIPFFKGSDQAAEKLVELDEFKNAKVVKVNSDRPQEYVRAAVLQHKKELVVPTPRFQDGFLRLISLDENATEQEIKNASRYREVINCSKPLDIDTKIDIDLVVMGSVAVDRLGHRIGKGEGFSDLEFSIMMQLKAVKPDIVVVTTVHDHQVFDSFPDDIFQPFDVPVDIIVTPTQVIRVEKRLPKPTCILWSFLTQRRVDNIKILQKLLEADKTAGKDVTLKEEVKGDVPKRYRFIKNVKRQHSVRTKSETQDEGAAGESDRPQRHPNSRRRNPPKKDGSGESAQNGVAEQKPKPKRNSRYGGDRRRGIDFSLIVNNVDRSVYIKDFKAALNTLGVKPSVINQRKGSFILHFAKPRTKRGAVAEGEAAVEAATSSKSADVNEIIADLQGLKLTPIQGKDIEIKPTKPISRIETTDVTSV